MKIISMTATFGKLDNETLHLQEGLNVLTAPNEWGKSTWCAFLCAMLYGIDTRERSKADQLADKEKYMPWSGKPMEGSIRLLHEGRDITIQRRTRGRVPMGEFLAWETETGLTIRELTADNCGQTLLGVEKSVFLRTGFLRFTDLPVKADEALRRRLNALVTTGDESGSADRLGQKLKELKNRCRHNQTGLIPECQAEIRDAQQKLWEVQDLQKQHDLLQDQQDEQSARLEALENHREHLDWKDVQSDSQRIEDARTAVRTAVLLEKSLEDRFTEKPDRASVEAKLRQGQARLDEVELYVEEPPDGSVGILLAAMLGAMLFVMALLMTDRRLLLPCLLVAFALLFASALLYGKQRRQRLWYNIEKTRRQGKYDELVKFLDSWRGQLKLLEELERARENTGRAQTHLADLEAMGRTARAPQDPDALTLSREETMRAIGEVNVQLERSRTRRAQLQGQLERLPDEEQLQRKLSQCRHRLVELEKTSQAIGYAQNALEEAMQELQRRFAPRITRRAGALLGRLTGGAYDRISIGEDLSILAARRSEGGLRAAQWRSEGTMDQMYLSLRLAVWEELSPNSPMVLDDALIRFDQSRMEQALDVLSDLGKNRQIILFTCQNREKEYLSR